MYMLTCPLSVFQQVLRRLAEDRQGIAFARVGTCHAPPDREWLVRDLSLSPPNPHAAHPPQVVRVSLATSPPGLFGQLRLDPLLQDPVGHLFIGDGPWRGHLWGIIRIDQGIQPLHHLSLIGAGMHRIHIGSFEGEPPRPDSADELADTPRERWSRTIGALGGEAVWQRLVGLHIAIAGCGRTGSQIVVNLARVGIRHLTLIDPDIVEMHNLGEMDGVTDADLRRSKAEALAEHVSSITSACLVQPMPIVAPITDAAAVAAAKACDVLLSCLDNDGGRLAAGILATLYHRPLLDIGTGVFFPPPAEEEGGRQTARSWAGVTSGQSTLDPVSRLALSPPQRRMGADVRLILPGDGCLLCRGNLTTYAGAVEQLCNQRCPTVLEVSWRQQRAGSLRTLNQIAAGLAVQMLQDLVAERIQSSIWAQVELDEAGHLEVRYPPIQPTSSSECPLCAKAGLGDEGLRWMESRN